MVNQLDIDLLNRIETFAFDNYSLRIYHSYQSKTVPTDLDFSEISDLNVRK